MKLNHLPILFTCLVITITVGAQNQSGVDSTGLPGDNFSLQGALEMFQKASSPEDFEKLLNEENNHVNNLDLNEDGEIDYIRVIDNSEKNAHAFVLQAIISEKESQDIAVIEIEKTGDASAIAQIVGDEDIYGEQVIVEPSEGDDNSFIDNFHNSSSGPDADYNYNYYQPRIIVNVWFWPSIRFIYAPAYRSWISPWRWHNYPGWWRPWRPFAWHVWRPFHRPFYNRFAIVRTHRTVYAHKIYTPHRVSSVTVRNRHATTVGNYRVTRTKTTVTGPKGHGMTKTKTTVKGPKGNKATKTKVRRH